MANPRRPLVSVIMPVYNGALFVGEAIDSILAQTYKPLELVIVNDHSKDETPGILNLYHKKFPKIVKVIHLKKNIGESAAANVAFRKTKGEYVARMDADDICHPQKLDLQVKYLLSHPAVGVVGTQAEVINSEGEVVGKKTFHLSHQQIYQQFVVVIPILHPSCLFRRSMLPAKSRLYENKFEPNDDYYTLFKLLNYGKFANLPQKLFYYRVHGKNKSFQHPKAKFQNSLRIRAAAIRDLGYQPTILGRVLMLGQKLLIFLMPEKLIVPIYMLVRGMQSPLNLIPGPKISLPNFSPERLVFNRK